MSQDHIEPPEIAHISYCTTLETAVSGGSTYGSHSTTGSSPVPISQIP